MTFNLDEYDGIGGNGLSNGESLECLKTLERGDFLGITCSSPCRDEEDDCVNRSGGLLSRGSLDMMFSVMFFSEHGRYENHAVCRYRDEDTLKYI